MEDDLPDSMPDDVTLGYAREWVSDRVLKGTKCPCCYQEAKVYDRKLHSGMAVALIHMYVHRDDDDIFDITTHLLTNKGDTSKLRHYGLIERVPDTKRGIWKITPRGKQFVEGKVRIMSNIELYNKELLDIHGELISIHDALEDKFDYDELMSTPGTHQPPKMDNDGE